MNADKNEKNPQQQTAENRPDESLNNPFENKQPVAQQIETAKEEAEKEQEFKEAQTERD